MQSSIMEKNSINTHWLEFKRITPSFILSPGVLYQKFWSFPRDPGSGVGVGGVSTSTAGLPILALGMFYCPSLLFCSWPSFSLSSFFLSRDLRLLDSAQCVPHWDTRYMARSSLILPACFPTSYFTCVNDPELNLPLVPLPTGLAGQDSSVSACNVDL